MIIENEVETLQRLQTREAAFCVLFSPRDGEVQAKSGKDNAENIGLGWKSELFVAVICSSLLFDVC